MKMRLERIHEKRAEDPQVSDPSSDESEDHKAKEKKDEKAEEGRDKDSEAESEESEDEDEKDAKNEKAEKDGCVASHTSEEEKGKVSEKKGASSKGSEIRKEAEKAQKGNGGETTTTTRTKSIGRPSAAALGFSTVGMSDQQVQNLVKKYEIGKTNITSPSPPAASSASKQIEKDKQIEQKGKTRLPAPAASPATSDMSISSDEPDSSSSSSDEESDSSKIKGPEEEEKVEKTKAGYRIRTEFPKHNIRRWMSPGPKFEVPANLPSKEDILRDKREMKQLHMKSFTRALPEQLPNCSDVGQAEEKKVKTGEEKDKDTNKRKLKSGCQGTPTKPPRTRRRCKGPGL